MTKSIKIHIATANNLDPAKNLFKHLSPFVNKQCPIINYISVVLSEFK